MRMQMQVDPKLSRRNYWYMLFEGAVWWLGWAVVDGNTVVSVFISQTTGSLAMVGLVNSVHNFVVIAAQISLGLFMYKLADRERFVHVIGIVSRPVMLLLVPALLLGVWGMPAAILFTFCYGIFFLFDGMVGLMWNEIMASTVAPNMRGRIVGNQQVVGGLLALTASAAVPMIFTSGMPAPHQFALIFGINGAIMCLNAYIMTRIKDAPPELRPERRVIEPRDYARTMIALFKKSDVFRRTVAARMCHSVVLAVTSMFILFGKQTLGITQEQAASLIIFSVLGKIIGGFLWGRISQKISYRAVMSASSLLNILVMSIGVVCFFLAGKMSLFIPLCAMLLLAAINACSWLGYTHHLITHVDPVDRPHYLVLQAVVTIPVTFTSYFAGLIAGGFGFGVIFGIALCFAALGSYIVHFRLREKSGKSLAA